MTERDLDEIQGLIVRGYHMNHAAHAVMRIADRKGFMRWLEALVEEDPRSGPFITVATDWSEKPPVGEPAPHCVNIGFTFDGLRAIGLSDESLSSFPSEFQEGAWVRAAEVDDTGVSDPKCWRPSLQRGQPHLIVSVHANDKDEVAAVADEIRDRAAGAVLETDRLEAHRLNDQDVEHFGYRDGLSQPTIEGVPFNSRIHDPFPPVPAGEFVLGHRTLHERSNPVPTPAELGRNGSFAALRIMEQDVAAFEDFLAAQSAHIDPELLAAKLCGRWRTGEPLVLAPSSDAIGTIPLEGLNSFDYKAAGSFSGDFEGLLCPQGAHIRRAFPRSQRVADNGRTRRIIRRGMPYGPAYDREHPTGENRGLIGVFICASLAEQFEYVTGQWLNNGLTLIGGLRNSRDPLTGANDPDSSRFNIPGLDLKLTGFPRFVRTRGAAYLFLPSTRALTYLAHLP